MAFDMPDMLEMYAWLLTAAFGGCTIYWAVVLWRVHRTIGLVGHVRDGADLPPPPRGWPTVSIVVPVHNEERVIDRCLTSLRGQDHPDLQIVLVLDRCTDGTAAIVERHAAVDPRIVVIENGDCPAEWAGKCNAARVGAARATGEWLLFVDADVRLDPQLVRSAQAIAVRDGVSLLSLVGRLTVERRFERLVQPAASMTLLRMFPLERVSHPRTPRAFANGQFLLFRRADYDAIGGHHAVRDDLLEDLAFARAVQHGGRRLAVLFADEMLEVSMYDSLAAFRSGWRRILIESCVRSVSRLRRNGVRILLNGALPPALVLLLALLVVLAIAWSSMTPVIGVAAAAAVLALVVQTFALAKVYRRMGVGVLWTFGYPIAAAIVAVECFRGADDLSRRRPIRWGGREYVIAPR